MTGSDAWANWEKLVQNGLTEIAILLSQTTMKTSSELELQAALHVASLMAAAARTAPKTRGIDNIRVVAIDDEAGKYRLADQMRQTARSEQRPSFDRDATRADRWAAVVAIGFVSNPAGLNCGYCGYAACQQLESANGTCSFNSIDLGIASSSATSVAADSRANTDGSAKRPYPPRALQWRA